MCCGLGCELIDFVGEEGWCCGVFVMMLMIFCDVFWNVLYYEWFGFCMFV